MASKPTQRTIAELKALGAEVQIVERWNPFAKRRVDLFGFIDILALLGPNILAIQTTGGAGGNHAKRRTKILAEPRALAWLKAGGLIELWSWALRTSPVRKKNGKRSKVKVWTCRKEAITLEQIEAA
jgi:hypothetical protein